MAYYPFWFWSLSDLAASPLPLESYMASHFGQVKVISLPPHSHRSGPLPFFSSPILHDSPFPQLACVGGNTDLPKGIFSINIP